ncbi:threonine/serine exporter family protein [Desulfosporosinus sp. BG]|uniref:threonine/serine exporter family protein n=1 Tax=Desulfosporosinus sp. BG TaxID=1633135 RepID=UPI00083A3E1A|nr:threonine/serine exporter family protein [Desulfosporosinus sp. BG]ODA39653.1 Integral membrane protein [Desulfosporosinus sp. BG]
MLTEITVAFIAALAFAVVFNVPVRYLLPGALAGTIGWLVFRSLGGTNTAIFFSSLGIGLLAEGGARMFRVPVLIIAVPGIIPLVPGAGAYSTMLALVKGNFIGALTKGTETLFAAGAIAVGIAIATVPLRLVQKGGEKHIRKTAHTRITSINPPEH